MGSYIACFFAGMFLTNMIPHFVHGISGDRFPTPFAKPPGKGLSSSLVNVVWALFNLLAGSLLVWVGCFSFNHAGSLFAFFAGLAATSVGLSVALKGRDRE